MHSTPFSLLHRLRQPDEAQAWGRFVDLYTPLIVHWGRKLGASPDDLPDYVQDVFLLLVRELRTFEYRPDRRFRGWLWTVAKNRWLERQRHQQSRPLLVHDEVALQQLSQDGEPALDEAEYRQYLVRRALCLMQAEFQPTTWKACWECVVHDRSPREVANSLGITPNAVYVACSRVLRHLRQELDGMLE